MSLGFFSSQGKGAEGKGHFNPFPGVLFHALGILEKQGWIGGGVEVFDSLC